MIYNRKPTHPVTGKVIFDGTPLPGANVAFHLIDAKDPKKTSRVADGFAEADGTARLSTYVAFDGVPEGDYKVTIVWREPFFERDGKLGANRLPAQYATPAATELTAKVKSGPNSFTFELTK
jgi:hypothetical protein